MGDGESFDRVLSPFLAAPGEEGADRELSRLLGELAAPLVQRLVRAQLAGLPAADLEDVAAETQLRLAERLRVLRGGAGEPIASFEAYVVATARNACRAHLRARRPAWTRLSNQVRYLLGHDPALATWRGADGRQLAGLAAWRDRPVAAPAARASAPVLPAPAAELALGALLRQLLLARGGPWPLSELVARLAELRGIEELREVPLAAGPEEGEPALDPPDPGPGPERSLADRRFVAAVWDEVALLPLAQRRALLLNLRDGRGADLLSLLPAAGLAPLAEIARALELGGGELAALWPRLPLEDRELGERFGLTQRQVINLRKSARERLARRMLRRASPSGQGR